MPTQTLNHKLFDLMSSDKTTGKLMLALHQQPGQTVAYYVALLTPELQVKGPQDAVEDALERFLKKRWVRREKAERKTWQLGGTPYLYWPVVGEAEFKLIQRNQRGRV